MLPGDIDLLRTPGSPALLPDGSAVVVALSQPDQATDEYVAGLWFVPLDGSRARRLTRGHADSEPDVSSDGRRVVFVRAGGGRKPQLHLVDVDGGEPMPLTDAPLGAGQPRFSPDGSRIVYTARVPEEGRYVAGGTPEAEAPRLVTQLRYRSDGIGYVRDRTRQLFVLDVPQDADDERVATLPVPRQLTDVDDDVELPRWFPAGDRVAAVLRRHADREVDLRRDAVVIDVPADGGEHQVLVPRPLTDADAGACLSVSRVLPASDGRRVWVLAEDVGPSGRDFVAALTGLYEIPSDGAPRRLTDPDEIDLDPAVLVEDGDEVLVAPQRSGTVQLVAVRADGSTRELLSGEVVVSGVAAAGGAVAVVRATPDSAGDVVVLERRSANERPAAAGSADAAPAARVLTDWSAPLRATGRVRRPEPLVAHAPDGYRVEGWLTTPDPARYGAGPYPTILMIHGGPFAQYTSGLFDEVQVLAGAGYAVVHGNPRGSSGRGRAHGRAIRRAFGTVDADDVLALLDAALADERLDASRTGVMGGSYGGYLTAWLTTRTQRFVAAVVERGFLDPVSFVGSSDIGWFFGLEYLGEPDGEAELVAAQSPMAHVGAVRTPTLVIHSEQDWRCPVEQGQRWFTELRRRGVESELLLFPGEGHELSRSGRPTHRVQRFEHVLRWWRAHLPTTELAATHV